MRKRLFLPGLLLGTAALGLLVSLLLGRHSAVGAAAAGKSPERPPCRLLVRGFEQVFALDPWGKRLKLQAAEACAQLPGSPYFLRGVRLTIDAGGSRFTTLESADGMYVPSARRVLLGEALLPAVPGCLAAPRYVSVDLRQGTVKTPEGANLHLAESWAFAPCRI